MTKNIKSIFFVLTLVTLLVTVGAVCAADDSTSTAASDNGVSDVTTVTDTTSDSVATETPQTVDNEDVNTKTIEKTTDKNIKSDFITSVSNGDELTTAINNIQSVTTSESYTINLNEGTYAPQGLTWSNSNSVNTLIINGNGQTINGINFRNQNANHTVLFNNIILNLQYGINNLGTTIFNNTTLNNMWLNNYGNITFNDDIIFGEDFKYYYSDKNANYTISNENLIIPYLRTFNGNYTLENMNYTSQQRQNYGNLTLINCTLNSMVNDGTLYLINCTASQIMSNAGGNVYINYMNISQITNYGDLTLEDGYISSMIINYGNITLGDNVELGSNLNMMGGGNYIVNDTNKLIPFMTTYSFDYVFNDTTLTGKTTNANITFNNVNASNTNNQKNLTVNRGLLSGTTTNNGNLILNNSIINGSLNNNNNLTIDNCTINAQITSNGNITILSGTINGTISNTGTVILGDSVIFTENTNLAGSGNYISNDTEKLIPYLETYDSNITFENMVLNGKTNKGNLTLINCNITNIKNNGNMTIINSRLNGNSNNNNYYYNMMIINSTIYRISNNGNLTIINSTIENTMSNDRNLTMENVTVNGTFTNYENIISSINCTYNNKLTNYGTNILIEGGVINSTIETTSGNVTFDDEVVFGENTKLSIPYGNGIFIINNTSKIATYVDKFDGIYNISDMDIDSKINNGNLTTYNCTFTWFTNNGNMDIMTGIVNGTISNTGNVTFSDDVIFGENTQLNGNGNYIINDYDKILPYLQVYNGNFTIENTRFTSTKTNKGNLTLNNCTIIQISNSGNLTLNNTTFTRLDNSGNILIENTIVNRTINNNNGNVTFGDNVTFGENTQLNGNGNYISNNPDMWNYVQSYRGNVIIINNTLRNIPNYGNITIINGTVPAYSNDANLTIINSTITGNITNYANLTVINSEAQSIKGNSTDANIALINSTCEAIYNEGRISYDGQRSNCSTLIENCNLNNTIITINGYNNILNSNFVSTRISAVGIMNIINSTFADNTIENENQYSNGGTVGGTLYLKSVTNSTISNCTFINNSALSTSTWATVIDGSGGAIYLQGCDNITIEKCNFINNSASGNTGMEMHWNDDGYFIVSTFNNGCGGAIAVIYSNNVNISNNEFKQNYAKKYGADIFISKTGNNITITNNTFMNSNANETIFFNETIVTYLVDSNPSLSPNDVEITEVDINKTITDNSYTNCSISFKQFNIASSLNGDEIEITGNIELQNPEFYDADILSDITYIFHINDEIIEKNTLSITITPTEEITKIYVTTPISQNRSNILVLKNTEESNIIISPENVENYIIEGELAGITDNVNITFKGEFNNIQEIYTSNNNLIIDGENATFTNTYFTLDANNITIKNMKITNNDISEYAIDSFGNNNIIINNTITQENSQGKTAAINTHGNNTIVKENTLTVGGPALSIEYSEIDLMANTQAILSNNGDNITISENKIKVYNTTLADDSWFSTIEAITTPGLKNSIISNNNINVTGARFNYGINSLGDVENINISSNNITVTGHRYTDGIQLGNNARNNLINNNTINLTCINTTEADEAAISYGIIVTSQGGKVSDNNTIQENNIEINGAVNYGMEIYTATNTLITENNITLTGVKSMGIGYAHSPNSTVKDNIIIINDESTKPLNSVTEEIQPQSVGIRIQQNSENITIENNTINTTDKAKNDRTIDTEDKNTIIINNQLESSTTNGAESIKTTQADTIIENNTDIPKENTLQVDTTSFTVGQTTTITASIYYGDKINTTINKGKISFKVNGKTLKDANSKVIYAKVINGTATIENYVVPEDWSKDGTTIQAVYSGSTQIEKMSSEKTEITLTTPEPTLTITPITDDVQTGSTVTFKAKVTTGDKAITTGKIVFKINGKTVKDANGKVIYAKVDSNGEASVDYTIPESFKAGTYNIEVVFTASGYEKLTDNTTMTVVKS